MLTEDKYVDILLADMLFVWSAFPTFPNRLHTKVPTLNQTWQMWLAKTINRGVNKGYFDPQMVVNSGMYSYTQALQTSLNSARLQYALSATMQYIGGVYSGVLTLPLGSPLVKGAMAGRITNYLVTAANTKASADTYIKAFQDEMKGGVEQAVGEYLLELATAPPHQPLQ